VSDVALEIVDDPARVCAERLAEQARAGGSIVLTGGSTPKRAYEIAAELEPDWSRVDVWWGDERCVPPDDERSNYGLVKASLLDPLGDLPRPVVHRMKGELGPHAAAEDYERELRAAGPPRFDLVLLGIGPDGHLASMFPDQESLSERSRLVLGVEEAGWEPYVPRVTMTLPALVNARQIVFLATGENKAGPVAAAFGPGARPDPSVPASLLAPLAKDVKVLLDRDAGRLVESVAERA
jgi:6-phosphogluconolactonase